jgi:hypothetical protein
MPQIVARANIDRARYTRTSGSRPSVRPATNIPTAVAAPATKGQILVDHSGRRGVLLRWVRAFMGERSEIALRTGRALVTDLS